MRTRWLQISSDLLLSLFTAGDHPPCGYRVKSSPIPSDARIIEARTSNHICWNYFGEARAVELLIESAEFTDADPDTIKPILETIPPVTETI